MSRVKKQIEFEDVRPIQLNLIHGQYTSRRFKRHPQLEQEYNDTYLELRQIQTENGIEERYVEVDYPITPDYVKSFANSTDYRNDIERAMNEPPRGVNMGDVTGIQEIMLMDMSAVKDLQSKLAERVKQLQEQSAGAENKTESEVKE